MPPAGQNWPVKAVREGVNAFCTTDRTSEGDDERGVARRERGGPCGSGVHRWPCLVEQLQRSPWHHTDVGTWSSRSRPERRVVVPIDNELSGS